MSPVLSPSAGGVGTITNRREVLGAVRGPGVGSTCWDSVDAGWDVGAGRGAILRVGGTDAQTASMVALPGMATEPQLREEEAWSGHNRGLRAQHGWAHSWEPGGRREYSCHTTPQNRPCLSPPHLSPCPPPPSADCQGKDATHLLSVLGPTHPL